MIYVLEGADGTGKSTLAGALANKTGGHVLHGSYAPEWHIPTYHRQLMLSARVLAAWQPVIIDRWALSELVYGTVFRDHVSYDVEERMRWLDDNDQVTWVYCATPNTVERFKTLARTRPEMYERIDAVVGLFDRWIAGWTGFAWERFDLTKETAHDAAARLVALSAVASGR